MASDSNFSFLLENVPEGKSEKEIESLIENSGENLTRVVFLSPGVARVIVETINGLSMKDWMKKNYHLRAGEQYSDDEIKLKWPTFWSDMHSATSESTVQVHDDRKNITVVKGNIAKFTEADVLVNPVTRDAIELRYSGEVAKAFYKLGQEELQKEYEEAGPPEWFGTDLTVTGPAGEIRCKKIFHPAIGRYHSEKSIKLLTRMIEVCLKKAESLDMKSIAFPTVGCGRLGYDPTQVAKCFLEATKESKLQIYIIAYTEKLYNTFRATISPIEESGDRPPTDPSPTRPIIDRCNSETHRRRKSERSRSSSGTAVEGVLVEMPIFHSAIAELDPETTKRIEKLRTKEVEIHIDVRQSTVTLTGIRETLHKIKQRILKLLAEDELVRKNLDYIKRTKGVKEYLMALSQRNFIGFPDYWKNSTFPDLSKSESKRCQLVKGSQEYDAVSAFVLNTWIPSLATYGRDARGLVHSNIAIRKIWTIENPLLYTNYQFKLKALARKAADKPFSAISGLFGEPEVMTKRIEGVDYLNSQLIGELNEVYLLHGTSHKEEIIRNGIDSRFSAEKALFGRGAYFAESSTKSDQYADPNRRRSRAPKDEPLYMFVARVLLGQPFLSQEKRPLLKKAPCSTMGCKRDNCCNNHPMCDSVIGTHRDVSTPLLFREFIVYHPEQCYPEFLVEYVRL